MAVLYVPEIGDKLCLTKAWQFVLHPESRNSSIYSGMNLIPHVHYKRIEGELDKWGHPKVDHIHGWVDVINFPPPEFDWNNRDWDGVKYNEYQKQKNEWDKIANENMIVGDIYITFPAETILKVDRIYIRKGASEYSSITFHASNIDFFNGEAVISNKKKPKSYRFWAKLKDVNNINFDLVE